MLSIQSLSHSYAGGQQIDYPDWEIEAGAHAMILGNSGSGKTTLLHMIAGLLKPTNGSIRIANELMEKLSAGDLDKFRGNNIGIVFQKPHLVASLSVYENVKLAQYLGTGKLDGSRVEKLLSQLGLEGLANRKIYQLSQGQGQRVAIARALVNQPKLLLADEPTASLDDANAQKVIDLLTEQAEHSEATLLIATHDQRVKERFKNQMTL